jgi:hypothetical protein
MVDFSSRLKKFGKTFKTAKQRAQEEGGYGAELPDGRYMAKLEKCELTEAKSSGKLQVGFHYKIAEGENKGETVRKYQAVETEDDQVWLARELKRFGIQLDSLEELEDVVKVLNDADADVKITLKTKDSGQFLYVDKLLSEIDAGDFEAEDSDEDEEEDELEEEDETEEEDSEDADVDEDVESSEEESDDEDDDDEEDADEDDESEDEEDSDVELSIGMTVSFENSKGKEVTGKVIRIMEKEGTVKIKAGDKTYTVKAEDLSIPEDAEENDEPEVEEVVTPVGKKKVMPTKKTEPAKKAAPAKKSVAKKRR